MRYLVVARHGEFNEGKSRLNDRGREQVRVLAEKLAGYEIGKVFSAMGPRSQESAGMVGRALDVAVHAQHCFGHADNEQDETDSFSEALALVRTQREGVLIVTKNEWAKHFIPFVANELLGTFQQNPIELERGEGVVFDSKEKQTKLL
ncbi:hypothetical protein GVX82_00215 [Patescibacteria group bacterium]|jgi:phosphohistidine phosphatase SixA|nr:hypothetical protein [Patescibacteria group bacterium]